MRPAIAVTRFLRKPPSRAFGLSKSEPDSRKTSPCFACSHPHTQPIERKPEYRIDLSFTNYVFAPKSFERTIDEYGPFTSRRWQWLIEMNNCLNEQPELRSRQERKGISFLKKHS